jgi:hypothetical protein
MPVCCSGHQIASVIPAARWPGGEAAGGPAGL